MTYVTTVPSTGQRVVMHRDARGIGFSDPAQMAAYAAYRAALEERLPPGVFGAGSYGTPVVEIREKLAARGKRAAKAGQRTKRRGGFRCRLCGKLGHRAQQCGGGS